MREGSQGSDVTGNTRFRFTQRPSLTRIPHTTVLFALLPDGSGRYARRPQGAARVSRRRPRRHSIRSR